jgi:hypothetical protein
MTSKERVSALLEKYIAKFAPNPGFLERQGIAWFRDKVASLSEMECYQLLEEAHKA